MGQYDIKLRRNLSPPASTLNIAMRGLAQRTTSIAGEVYWRDPNDATSVWQLLGEAKAGGVVQQPFDLKGRTIELSLISKTAEGFRSTNLIENGVRTLFSIGPPALTALTFSAPDVTGTIANNG